SLVGKVGSRSPEGDSSASFLPGGIPTEARSAGNKRQARKDPPALMMPEEQERAADVAAALDRLAERVERCRLQQECGADVCGIHAVGKPTHQLGAKGDILVVGEAPGPHGWWLSGRAFYSATADARLTLSQTGINLNACLEMLDVRIEDVGF